MERNFRIPEISDELGIEGKLGIAGGCVGFIGGVAIDMYYLNHPSANFDDRISSLRTNIDKMGALRSDLRVLPPRQQAVVQSFITKDTVANQTKITALTGHPQPSPPVYEKVGIVAVSTALVGMAVVAAGCVAREYRQKRTTKRQSKMQAAAQEYEEETKIQELVDSGLERINLWRRREEKRRQEKE